MSVVESLPVVSRIADELYQRLDRLRAQYIPHFIASEVVLPTRIANYTPQDRQIVITRGAQERVEELDCDGNPPALAYRQTFNIRCHISPHEKDTTPIDQITDTAEAAIRKTVCDTSRWWTFGELALDAQWQTIEPISAENGVDGFNLPLAVTYRTDESNPWQVRA